MLSTVRQSVRDLARRLRFRRVEIAGDPQALGRRGEALAEQFLAREQKMRLVDRNVRLPGGEIDLIMEAPDGAIVFIEVKTRTSDRYKGEFAINAGKRRRLIQLAQRLARRFGWTKRRLRIDVIVIVWSGAPGEEPVIRYHPNAVTL